MLLAMAVAMHCARPRAEANCRCDVSFEQPLIMSRHVHTHLEKENTDGKSLKSSASLVVVMKSETPEA